MSNENFRRELNNAFEQMSGAPSPSLRDRVRSSVGQAPEARGPYWIAAVAACVIALTLVGVLFVANPLNRRPSPGRSGQVTTSPSPSATPTASPTASPQSSLPAFTCTSGGLSTSPPQPQVAYISDLRTGAHSGYDRLTVTFSNGMPNGSIDLRTQSGTTFTASPSGMQMTLKGSNGLLVIIHGSDLHTSYNGPIDIVTGYSTLVEVRRVEDFEGVVQLGMGINGPACYRAFLLTNPDRLVIDIQAAS